VLGTTLRDHHPLCRFSYLRAYLIVAPDTFRGVKAFADDSGDIGVVIGFMGKVCSYFVVRM
jgi:hypothetical protein